MAFQDFSSVLLGAIPRPQNHDRLKGMRLEIPASQFLVAQDRIHVRQVDRGDLRHTFRNDAVSLSPGTRRRKMTCRVQLAWLSIHHVVQIVSSFRDILAG